MNELRLRLWPTALCAMVLCYVQACDRRSSAPGAPNGEVASSEANALDSEPGGSEPEPERDESPTLDEIDADWVASKFQAPSPPPVRSAWVKEIEEDPVAALRNMDPGALQPTRPTPLQLRPSSPNSTPNPVKSSAAGDPGRPLKGWPPVVGQPYPDLALKDQNGQLVALSDFRGKVILVELVGLTCRACHAFAGGNEPGVSRFRNVEPQRGLASIERYVQGYAKISLEHPDIVFVQLVLYGMDGKTAPSQDDVRAWAAHFELGRNARQVVLVGDSRFISPETRKLIPGFHLIDRRGILRAINSNDPRHDRLESALLPMLARLVETGS